MVVKYISLRGLWCDMDEMFFILIYFLKGHFVLLGNRHLMDKNEVRILYTYSLLTCSRFAAYVTHVAVVFI
jgi:hypothetical protein